MAQHPTTPLHAAGSRQAVRAGVVSLSLALTFAGATALADGFAPWSDLTRPYDTDHNGGVSLEEAQGRRLDGGFTAYHPYLRDHFSELDSNHDGIVTQDELAPMLRITPGVGRGDAGRLDGQPALPPANPVGNDWYPSRTYNTPLH